MRATDTIWFKSDVDGAVRDVDDAVNDVDIDAVNDVAALSYPLLAAAWIENFAARSG